MKYLRLIIAFLIVGGIIGIANQPKQGLIKTGNTNMALSVGVQSNPYNSVGSGPSSIAPPITNGSVIQPGGNANTGGVPVGTVINVPGSSAIPLSSTAGSGVAGTTAQQQAAAAAQAAQDAKINTAISNGYAGASAGGQGYANNASDSLTAQGMGDLTTAQTGQNTIDEARKSIGLNQINGIKDLMNTIKQGLQGTGVQLGSTNALDSSAAGAAARAYGNYGNVEENKINNSAADSNQQQDVNQANLNLTRDNQLATLQRFRDDSIDTIKQNAIQALAALSNTVAFMGGDSSKVDMNGVRDQIVQRAQDQLGAVDQHISSMLQGVHAASADQTAQNAYQASNAGATPSGPNLPFQLDQSALTGNPAQPGADGSMIPLTLKSKALA